MRERQARFEEVVPRQALEYHDPSEFDRIAFALRVLRRLFAASSSPYRRGGPRKPRLTVAVYSAIESLQVQRGTGIRDGREAAWAMVGIPPHASREHIAYALVELVGAASVPYAVQALLAEERTVTA